VARVVAYIPDLLFGSSVLSALRARGQQVELASDVSGRLEDADLLIVDLTTDPDQRIEEVQRLRPPSLPVLAFYSHVEADVRTRAEEAGFDLVVPRSRMAREGAALVDRLLAGG
jgi:hypothetical protein